MIQCEIGKTIGYYTVFPVLSRQSPSMTLLYYDPIFQEHVTGDHPENPGRLSAVMHNLHFNGFDSKCARPAWEPATIEQLSYVHTPEYIASVERYATAGGGRIEADTVVCPRSYEVARHGAGAVCDAVGQVLSGTDKNAFCLVRPPGHHALADAPMGFCLFNHVAIGARAAQREHGIERVLVVDFDVHHGNGTQDIFYDDASVGFFSMHRFPFYPGSGAANERGTGEGAGATWNLPIAANTPASEQLALFADELAQFADRIQPQLVMLSAGFDSHRDDPVGGLGLASDDFRALTKTVLEIAQTHASGRLISLLEGGYNPQALAECVEIHIAELLAGAG
ncbi:MAG: histone deacetylase [Pirellulaceae bacterium]